MNFQKNLLGLPAWLVYGALALVALKVLPKIYGFFMSPISVFKTDMNAAGMEAEIKNAPQKYQKTSGAPLSVDQVDRDANTIWAALGVGRAGKFSEGWQWDEDEETIFAVLRGYTSVNFPLLADRYRVLFTSQQYPRDLIVDLTNLLSAKELAKVSPLWLNA